MARTVRRGAPPRPLVRLALNALEDRLAPALFTAQPGVAATGLNNNGSVAVGDFNKDGVPDAVLANFGTGYGSAAGTKITVLYGNGSGGYALTRNFSTGGKNIAYVDVGDINGDGWLDIAAGNATTGGAQADGSSVSVFLNDQTGNFAPAVGSPFATTGFRNLSSVDLADVTGDGQLDLVVACFGYDNGTTVVGQGIVVYQGNNTGKFALLATMDPASNANLGLEFIPTNAQVADFNGDTVPDIAATVPGVDLSGGNDPSIDGFVYIFAGTGSGAFTNSPTTFGSGGGLPITMTVANVDGKNGPDILIANAGDANAAQEFKNNAVGVLINNGGGGFSENAVSTNERGTFAVAAADFNGDTKIDIAAANYGSQDGSVDAFVSVYYGNGTGGFIPATLDGSPFDTGYGHGGAQFLAVGDFDGNTSPDLIVAHAPYFDPNTFTFVTKVTQLRNDSKVLTSSTTAVTVAPAPSSYGQGVTITATVSGPGGPPTGTVEFFDGAASLGTVTLAAGVATKAVTALVAGSHTVQAKYLGDTAFAASTGTTSHTVTPATTTVGLVVTPTTVTVGETVAYTATVTGFGGAPVTAGSVQFFYGSTSLGSKALDGTGTAAFTSAALPVGVHAVHAKYAATTNYAADDSNTETVTVTAAPAVGTNTLLTSSGSPTVFGSQVTFTATVGATSGGNTPTGTVLFFDGTTQIGAPQTLAGGVAQLQISSLAVGGHTIQAKYQGATGFTASDSNALSHTVTAPAAATSTVTLSSSKNPSTFGDSVTFTAQVSASAGTPLGTVTFFADGSQIGQVTIAAGNGSPQFYQLPYDGLAVGTRAITASYSGTAGISGNTSAAFNQLVTAVTTSTVLISSGSPTTFTQTVTFTATVAGTSGTPTGQVEFFDGAVSLGTATLGPVAGQQKAVLPVADLTPGAHTVTAKYLGAAGYDPSQSGNLAHTVTPITTATGLQSSGSPAAFGGVVVFTATVTGTLGSPTGVVNFFAAGVPIGSAPLSAAAGTAATASLPYGALPVGASSITAAYAGATGYSPSTSSAFNQVVAAVPTTTAVTSNGTPAFFGNGVTVTATVTSGGGTPTGGVEFFDGGTSLGTRALALVGGVPTATYTTSGLTVGSHTITAKYAAAGNFAGSASASFVQVVSPATTAIGFTADPAAGTPGTAVTLTATVTVTAGAGTPTGSVNFYSNGTILGSKAVSAAGVAAFTTALLPAGDNTVQAMYVATTNYAGSASATGTVTITAPPSAGTTTALVAAPAGTTFAEPVTFTATVAAGPGGPVPGGTVAFYDGATLLGSKALSGNTATYTTSALGVGGHTVTAKFSGTTGFDPSASAPAAFTVDLGPTTITVSAPGAGVAFGQLVPLTATVAAAFGTPTGTVAFFDGGVQIGTAALLGDTATFETGFAVGPHTITAKYLGTAQYSASTASAVALTAAPAASATTLAASAAAGGFGAAVTFTATVVSPAGGPPGRVTFYDGPAELGTVALAGGAAVFTTTALGVGPHAVTAKYLGETNFAPSTSAAATYAATQLPTAVTVSATPAAVREGESVTLTATLAFPAGAPVPAGGTVTFFANGANIGTGIVSGGTAAITRVLPAGTPSVTATYAGDAVYTGAGSAAVSVTVARDDEPLLTGFKEFGVGGGAGNDGTVRFFNPNGAERFAVDVFPGFTGGVRVSSADFNGDGVADLVAGTGPGRASRVVVIDGVSKQQLFAVDPFEAAFVGGVYVTTGDVTGDGVPDLVISPDEGGGPRIDVYSGAAFGKVISFFGIDDPNFRGGARAAVADVNGDGAGDLIVAAGFGGGPRVAGYSGPSLGTGKPTGVFPDYFAFEETLRNGVFITAGDLDGDGKAEVIAGGGPGGGPRITAFGAAQLVAAQFVPVANFFAGNTENRGGVRLVARDLDDDGRADLVVGDGAGAGSRVTGYIGADLLGTAAPEPTFGFDAFPGSTNGVYVG